MESTTSASRAIHSHKYGVNCEIEDFDDCSFDDESESYTESESMTFDDEEEEESLLELSSGDSEQKPSLSFASIKSTAPTQEEKRNGLVLSMEMVQFLRKSASEGNVAGMLSRETMKSMTRSTFHQKSVAPDHSKKLSTLLAMKNQSSTDLFRLNESAHVKESALPSPKATLEKIWEAQGKSINYRKYTDVPSNYFVECDVNPHSLPLLKAVRGNDLATIRYMHEVEGLSLQCSNKFQESLVHTVARHGLSELLLYLKEKAGVSLRVCCDGGRNALHDACWTNSPNFNVICILIQDSPDLLYITDKRNFTPLDYVPKEAYGVWNEWLEVNKPFLVSIRK